VSANENSAAASEREALLRRTYEGEIIGETIFAALHHHARDDRQREACRLIEDIELVTGRTMSSVIARHRVICDEQAARDEGAAFAATSIGDGWRSFWERLLPLSEDALADMRRLRELSDQHDRDAIDQLVMHEELIIDFIRRELAGAADALDPLKEYLARYPLSSERTG